MSFTTSTSYPYRIPGVCERARVFGRRVELCSYYFIEADIEMVFFVFFFLMEFLRRLFGCHSTSLFSDFVILLNCVHCAH